MDLQDVLPALQVGQLHGNAPVEPPRPGQGRVQGLGPVGSRQDDDAGVALKAVHLREELVQRLLPLVVAAHLAVPLFADGVDLVDEHDAGGLLLGLPEQVPDLAGAHAHEHLHELRAGHGEEGHIGLACHGLGQHGLAGAGRAHQQHALGHGGADLPVFLRVMEVLHDLLQIVLGLILAGHVGELDALGGLHVHLGAGLAKRHGVGAAQVLHHPAGEILPQGDEDHDGQHPAQEEADDGIRLPDDLAGEPGAGILKHLLQVRVRDHAGGVDGGAVLIGKDDLILRLLDLHLAQLVVLRHVHEGAVVHLPDLLAGHPGHGQEIEQQQDQHGHAVVKDQRPLRWPDFFHTDSSFFPLPSPSAGPGR